MLLTCLHLGLKPIRVGPVLPAFITQVECGTCKTVKARCWPWAISILEELKLCGALNSENRTVGEKEFFIENLPVRIHLIIEMILVDRACNMGV